MNKKKDYSAFYICMIIILCFMFSVVATYSIIETEKYQKHLDKDLEFARETGEFIVYEAEIIGYCANMSNISSTDLIKNFTRHKAMELLDDWDLEVEENSIVIHNNETMPDGEILFGYVLGEQDE